MTKRYVQKREDKRPEPPWKPQRQLMTQFLPHAPEGSGTYCDACACHRDNKLIHPPELSLTVGRNHAT